MVDQGLPIDAQCPSSAALLGYGGVAAAVCLSNWGSAVSDPLYLIMFRLLACILTESYLRLFIPCACYRWEHGKPGKVSFTRELDIRHQ